MISSALYLFAFLSQPPLETTIAQCQLKIVALDAFGHAVSLRDALINDSVDMKGNVYKAVECGRSRLFLSADGFVPHSEEINVLPGPNLRLVFMGFSATPTFRATRRVTIRRSQQQASCTVIRVFPVASPNTYLDHDLSIRDAFGLVDVPAGRYIIVLLGAYGVCGSTSGDLLPNLGGELMLTFP